MDGLFRVRNFSKLNKNHTTVILVVISSDSSYLEKVTGQFKIVKNVNDLNMDIQVKIFMIGFNNLDMALFDAISLINTGILTRTTSEVQKIETQHIMICISV